MKKEQIENFKNIVKPFIANLLLRTNYEEMGKQDKEEFEEDFDEIIDLAIVGLNQNSHNNGPGTITNATADRLKEFNTARDWDKIHTPANLAKSISIEAAELLELFQWDEKSYDVERVKEELADVIIYSLIMVEALNLDADAIVNEKITKNSKKYPTGVQVKDGNK